MTRVRLIALGNPMASDDGAALAVAERLRGSAGVEVVLAGRPGPGLLDLLEPGAPTLILDVVRLGSEPGRLVELPLDAVAEASLDGKPLSSHGFGLAQALKMAGALGRTLPRGSFLGVGGECFEPGTALTGSVRAAMDDLEAAARKAITALSKE